MPLSDRIQFETLLSDISARLIAVGSDRLEETIQSALDAVRRFFRADRCGLLSGGDELRRVKVIHAAYSEGVPHVEVNALRLAELLQGRRVRGEFWITTARPTKQIADRMGYTRVIEASGAGERRRLVRRGQKIRMTRRASGSTRG